MKKEIYFNYEILKDYKYNQKLTTSEDITYTWKNNGACFGMYMKNCWYTWDEKMDMYRIIQINVTKLFYLLRTFKLIKVNRKQ